MRIAGAIYAIKDEKDGIYAIEPKLDAAATAGTPVARVTRFELSAMRDLQQHVLYLGHKELLNLEQARRSISISSPRQSSPGSPRREVAWELWGKPDDAEAADWKLLEAAVGAASVRLRKAWVGKTEETEVGGQEEPLAARPAARSHGRRARRAPLRSDRAAGAVRGAAGRGRASTHRHSRVPQRHAAAAARAAAAVRSRTAAVRPVLPRRTRGALEEGRARDAQDRACRRQHRGRRRWFPGRDDAGRAWRATGGCKCCAAG